MYSWFNVYIIDSFLENSQQVPLMWQSILRGVLCNTGLLWNCDFSRYIVCSLAPPLFHVLRVIYVFYPKVWHNCGTPHHWQSSAVSGIAVSVYEFLWLATKTWKNSQKKPQKSDLFVIRRLCFNMESMVSSSVQVMLCASVLSVSINCVYGHCTV